jgi:predicted transcriptional regulator
MNNQRTEPIHIRTTPETVQRLESVARHLSMSKTAVVQMALNEYFARHAPPDRTAEERETYSAGKS